MLNKNSDHTEYTSKHLLIVRKLLNNWDWIYMDTVVSYKCSKLFSLENNNVTVRVLPTSIMAFITSPAPLTMAVEGCCNTRHTGSWTCLHLWESMFQTVKTLDYKVGSPIKLNYVVGFFSLKIIMQNHTLQTKLRRCFFIFSIQENLSHNGNHQTKLIFITQKLKHHTL